MQRVFGHDRVISAGPDHFETQNDSGFNPDLHEQFRGTVQDFFQELRRQCHKKKMVTVFGHMWTLSGVTLFYTSAGALIYNHLASLTHRSS